MTDAIKVKPLVWEHHPAGAIAAPPTGFAYIIDTRMKGRVYSLKGFNPQREFASLDEAKAAAQADYEQRVLSAIADLHLAIVATAKREAKNEALRGAISYYHHFLRNHTSLHLDKIFWSGRELRKQMEDTDDE